MTLCHVEAIGLAAPGLEGWARARAVLAGDSPWTAESAAQETSSLLPPNERRRATAAVRQAFRAGEDALACATRPAAALATVFASADGDMNVLHRICHALAQPTRLVSPTDFHNSVHNAASGYWSIAAKSMAPAMTVAAHDASFAAGLLEAASLVAVESRDVLLIAYDVPAPSPLSAARRIDAPASVALILTPERTANTQASLVLQLVHDDESYCRAEALEAVRFQNPALRALPLLEYLARGECGAVVLPSTGALKLRIAIHAERNLR